MTHASDWLNEKFPTQESRREVKKLKIGMTPSFGWYRTEQERNGWLFFEDNLVGELDLNTFLNLEELAICGTKSSTYPHYDHYDQPQNITHLRADNCLGLRNVYLENGKLQSLDFSSNTKLTNLAIHDQKQLTSLKGLGKELTKIAITKCPQLGRVDIVECYRLRDFALAECLRVKSPFYRLEWLENRLNSRKAIIQQEINLLKEILGREEDNNLSDEENN